MASGEPTIVPLGDTPVTVGRRPNCTIVLNDIRISGSHVHFKAGDRVDAVLVEDTSANGTFVNGRRLTKGEPRVLSDGDVISLVTPLKQPPQQLQDDKRASIIAVFICNGEAPSESSVAPPTAAEASPKPVIAAADTAMRDQAREIEIAASTGDAVQRGQIPPSSIAPTLAATARAPPTPAAPAAPAAVPATAAPHAQPSLASAVPRAAPATAVSHPQPSTAAPAVPAASFTAVALRPQPSPDPPAVPAAVSQRLAPHPQPSPTAPVAPAVSSVGADASLGWQSKVRSLPASAAAPSRARASCGGKSSSGGKDGGGKDSSGGKTSSAHAAASGGGTSASPAAGHGLMEAKRHVRAEMPPPMGPPGPALARSCKAPSGVEPSPLPNRGGDRSGVNPLASSAGLTAARSGIEHGIKQHPSDAPHAVVSGPPAPVSSGAPRPVSAGGSTFEFDEEEAGGSGRERPVLKRPQPEARVRRAGRGVGAEPSRRAGGVACGGAHAPGGVGEDVFGGGAGVKRLGAAARVEGVEGQAKRRAPAVGSRASGAACGARTSTTLADVFSAFHGGA